MPPGGFEVLRVACGAARAHAYAVASGADLSAAHYPRPNAAAMAPAAYAAAYSAEAACDGHSPFSKAVDAVAAYAGVYAVATSSSDAFATAAAAFEQDRAMLGRAGVEALASAPLWMELSERVLARYWGRKVWSNHTVEFPIELFAVWAAMRDRLMSLDDDFAVWAEWYQGILHGEKNGRYLFGLPTERALRLNVDIALIPEEFWQSPARANAEIRRLVEVARGEGVAQVAEPEAVSPGSAGAIPPGLEDIYDDPEPKKPRNKKAKAPKTAIGKAMVANVAPIALQAALLIPLIDQEIERVKAERPNSEEAISAQAEHVQKLEKLKTDTLELQKASVDLAEEKITEKEALKKANAFLQPFSDCWNKDGEAFVRAGIGSGLFLGAVGIAHLLGMALSPLVTTTVLGAIVAEKPLVSVLKSAKGMFKFGG